MRKSRDFVSDDRQAGIPLRSQRSVLLTDRSKAPEEMTVRAQRKEAAASSLRKMRDGDRREAAAALGPGRSVIGRAEDPNVCPGIEHVLARGDK